MKALYINGPGDDNPTFGDLPEPSLQEPTDVIVRVRATAMNRLDVFRQQGTHGVAPTSFPYIGGSEYAGEVAEVGPEATQFKVGDRVFGTAAYTFAQYARIGNPGSGPHQRPPVHMPDGLSYEEAAAIPISFSMAWHMLHCKGNLKSGEDILVMAAGSGTGTSGIQMAKAAGARVIAGSSSDDKLDKARALGADEVINYQQTPEFSKRVRDLTDGQGVGFVFESIGAPVWEQCFASIKYGGRLVICGVTGGHKTSLHLGQLWMREISIIGCINEPENDLEDVVKMIDAGSIRAVVDSVLPLDSTEQAYDRMKERNFFGKVVLTIP